MRYCFTTLDNHDSSADGGGSVKPVVIKATDRLISGANREVASALITLITALSLILAYKTSINLLASIAQTSVTAI